MRKLGLTAFVALSIACGGGNSPTAPPSPAAPAQTEAATVNIDGVTINFAAGVTTSDRDLITRTATGARSYFQSAFGRTITGHVTVNVGAGAGLQQAQGHTITISAGDQVWTRVAAIGRTKTVAHEFFHVLQGEGGWTFQPIEWLYEGAAEYAGYATVVNLGIASYQTIRACEIDIYYVGGGSATPPLHEISFSLSSSVNSRYAVGWLGVDHLVGGLNGIGALRGMWENGGSMEQRFTSAFGRSPQAFSTEFQTARLSLPNSGGSPCSGF